MKKIVNDAEHATIMARINSLMAKGSNHVSKEELAEIRSLALIVQDYEQNKYGIDIGILMN
jgi:HTH-type transcriptional regulator/antitoxin HigA